MFPTRRSFNMALAGLALAASPAAFAQANYPDRPITMIVPGAPVAAPMRSLGSSRA